MVTITGYHGTTKATATLIASGRSKLKARKNDGDWLGEGVYFWQDAPARAWEWARLRYQARAAVIEARLELGECLDLFDLTSFAELATVHDAFVRFERNVGIKFKQAPLRIENGRVKLSRTDRGFINDRDQAFLDFALPIIEANRGNPISSIRAPFVYGRAIHPTSYLFNWAHVQICVRPKWIAQVVVDVRELPSP